MSFLLSELYGPTVAIICVLIAGIAVLGAVNNHLKDKK